MINRVVIDKGIIRTEFNLKNKHLAIVFGDWNEKKALIDAFEILQHTVTDGNAVDIDAAYCYELDIKGVGMVEYTISPNGEELKFPPDKRKTTILKRENRRGVVTWDVHKGVWTNKQARDYFSYLASDKPKMSLLRLVVIALQKFISERHAAVGEKIFRIVNYIEDIKIPSMATMLVERQQASADADMLCGVINNAVKGNVSIVQDVDSFVNPIFVKKMLEDVKPSILGQFILFTNNLELMCMEGAAQHVFFAVNGKVKCTRDYDFRTFKNNSIREKYLKGYYC